ncbi:hypothetical protein E2P81_ATG06986 [Venturia nashicola]|uniref:Secreted protein n=1 Tax=Venturia nashicola TaxID=86259 RepID=A0A4Z1NM71_9PEZI|nr:hypothetical protein E6O75_ATG07153 [Venturia nashicola]TLD19369.1 hypothetical protein E2P81_ATG06986 [Venturia nashicola]
MSTNLIILLLHLTLDMSPVVAIPPVRAQPDHHRPALLHPHERPLTLAGNRRRGTHTDTIHAKTSLCQGPLCNGHAKRPPALPALQLHTLSARFMDTPD